MAKISTYVKDVQLSDKDKVIGSNYINTVNGVDQFKTNNFTLKEISDFVGANISTSSVNLKANGGLVYETIDNVSKLAVDLGASSITGQLANADLANSSITINGTAISLGGTVTTPNTQLTDAQVRSKISVTGGGSYNSSTGVITIPAAFTLAQGNVTNASVSGQTLTLTRQSTSDVTFTPTANDFTNTLKTKLDNIESNATADQTAAEIRTLVGAATDSNVFTDNDHTKLDNIEANATADQTASEIKTLYESNSDTNAFTDDDHTKLDNIEANATADQTNAEIRAAVEAATDSNVFTDDDHTKLNGIAAGAEVNVQANWNESTNTSDAFIQNKPTLFVGTDISASTDNDAKGITVSANAASATIGLDVDGLTELTTADFNDDFLIVYDNNVATNKKIHPENIIPNATSSRRGGIKIGYTESGKNYPVELDSEKAYVNVPWTDTVYTLPTASSSTLGGVKVGGNLTIDGNGVLNVGTIALTTVQTAANETAHLNLTAQEGDIVVRSDQNKSYVHNGGTAGTMADYTLLLTPTDAVLSVTTSDSTYIDMTPNSPATGAITVTAALSAVDGTSDTNTRFLSKDNTWDVPSYTTDLDHDSLTNYVANEHIDWTTDQGSTNIHANNYNNTQLSDAQVITAIVNSDGISTANKGTIRTNIGAGTSNLALGTTATTALAGNTALFDGDYDSLTNKPTIPSGNAIIDWTTDQGSTNIHTGNYNNTQLSDSQVVAAVVASTSISNSDKSTFRSNIGAGTSSFDGDYDNLSNKPTLLTIGTTATTAMAGNTSIPSGNSIIDWTTDQGNTNIHTGNYNNTQLSTAQVRAKFTAGTNVSISDGEISATDTNTTYDVMGSGNSYAAGLVLAGNATHGGAFLRKDGSWQVPPDTDTNTNTTYTTSVPASTTKIRLTGSDSTNDDIEIAGGTNVTVTRNSASKMTIAATDTNTQRSNEDIRDVTVAMLTAGSNITLTENDTANTLTIAATDTNTTYSVGDGGLTQKNFTTTLKTKLDNIESNATADQTITAGNGLSGGGTGNVTLTNSLYSDNKFFTVTGNAAGGSLSLAQGLAASWNDSGGSGEVDIFFRDGGTDHGTNTLYFHSYNGTDTKQIMKLGGASTVAGTYVTMGGTLDVAGRTTLGTSGTANLYLGNVISPSSNNKGARFHSSNNDFYFDFQGDATQHWYLRDYDGSGGTHTRFSFDFINAKFIAGGDVVAFGSPSDKTLKENIKPIDNALDKVEKLQGVTFDWKEQDITNLKEDIGFIAQDVQKVLPELVRENKDGKLSLRHQGIIPVLLEAIKELSDKIKILENGSTK